MLRLLFTITMFSVLHLNADYEDEVRKRLGLCAKDQPNCGSQSLVVSSESSESEGGIIGRTGESVYNLGCAACHAAGLAGAPLFADQSQWEGRLEKGLEMLTNNAYNGYNAMPAKGLCMDCSLEEIERSVQYMLDAFTLTE
jgi:cytochrome c5